MKAIDLLTFVKLLVLISKANKMRMISCCSSSEQHGVHLQQCFGFIPLMFKI